MEDICNALVTNQWGAGEEEDAVRVWIESRLQKRGNESTEGSGWQTPVGEVAGDQNAENAEKEEKDGLGLVEPMKDFGVHDEDQREWADRESRGLPKDYAGVSRVSAVSCFFADWRESGRYSNGSHRWD